MKKISDIFAGRARFPQSKGSKGSGFNVVAWIFSILKELLQERSIGF